MTTPKASPTPAASSTPATTSVSTSPVPTALQPLTSASSLQHAPPVPNGFEPLTKEQLAHLKKFTKSQRGLVGPVATEVDGSATYSQDFGSYAPAKAQVVDLLEATEALITEQAKAQGWAKYVSNLTAVNIDAAEAELTTMGQGLEYAAQHSDAVLESYPQLMAFLKLRSVEISKTFATKAAAKKEAAKKAVEAAAPAPAAVAPAAVAK